jgi:outer membrane usher protein
VAIFTNGEGRFAADGLKPGLWRLELLSEPPVCFALSIPGGTAGLFNAGQLVQRCAS